MSGTYRAPPAAADALRTDTGPGQCVAERRFALPLTTPTPEGEAVCVSLAGECGGMLRQHTKNSGEEYEFHIGVDAGAGALTDVVGFGAPTRQRGVSLLYVHEPSIHQTVGSWHAI